jgi:hypothetical protein
MDQEKLSCWRLEFSDTANTMMVSAARTPQAERSGTVNMVIGKGQQGQYTVANAMIILVICKQVQWANC